jgi:hypothetical protein
MNGVWSEHCKLTLSHIDLLLPVLLLLWLLLLLLLLLSQVAWHDTLLPQQALSRSNSVAALFSWLVTALPDLQLKVAEVVSVEDHHILLYYTAAGTHSGYLQPSLGLTACSTVPSLQLQMQPEAVAPTGSHVSWTGSLVLRMRADTAAAAAAGMAGVEAWHSWDPLFMYQQIGLKPSAALPEAPAAAPVAQQGRREAPATPHAELQEAAVEVQTAAAAADTDSSQLEARKAVVRQYFDVYNSGGC